MYYAYVIQNAQGKLYKGFTSDIQKRIHQHNSNEGFSSYTSNKGPWKLVYAEEFDTEKEAREREKFFKTGKGREFIQGRLSAT